MRATGSDHSAIPRAEEGEKDKKKKRRQNRRLKQNSPPSVNGACTEMKEGPINVKSYTHVAPSINSPVEQLMTEVGTSDVHGLAKASAAAFNLMPSVHISEQLDSRIMENQIVFPTDLDQRIYPNSCPTDSACEVADGFSTVKDYLGSHQNDNDVGRKLFAEHWSMEAVLGAVDRGEAFKALFRVNAHNRLEAYCKIDGIKVDVLINGIAAQNRAVDGDIVAIKVDPLPLWTRMKGSSGPISNNSVTENNSMPSEGTMLLGGNCKGKCKVDSGCEYAHYGKCANLLHTEPSLEGRNTSGGTIHLELVDSMGSPLSNELSSSGPSHVTCGNEQNYFKTAFERFAAAVSSFPSKRPTGRVVGIIEKSRRRNTVVGFLSAKNLINNRVAYRKDFKNKSPLYIHLIPNDPKFQKMRVPVEGLPDSIKNRLEDGDATVETELVAARIDGWSEESLAPKAHVLHTFGRGGEVEPNVAAILFESAVCCSEFSEESLSCLPCAPWEIPSKEFACRRDLRKLCIFTIDPATATDLDDALSIEKLRDGIYRVGVHIADASYFVQPQSALDIEAQIRSTSVYLLRRKISMLPSLLSENLGSLIPGVDRLTFSIFFDINFAGDVIDRWVGRTVVRSCCKLSYEDAQKIITGALDAEKSNASGNALPQLHGPFQSPDIIQSVKLLFDVSKNLKENRFNVGALRLESSKVAFLYDEDGIPYDSLFCEREDSKFLVEEFMLLANTTAAEIISQAFPDNALLRRHPEPDLRKLRELEAFCSKQNLEVDTSNGQLNHSLERIKEKLKEDPVLVEIVISYALKPMQLSKYFCTGVSDQRENDWAHYALAVPVYTHFTSPLRRYPDILVHRMLAAAMEAENMYSRRKVLQKVKKSEEMRKCFTGVRFDGEAASSIEGQESFAAATLKHGIPSTELLANIASHCNDRALASRHVKDACNKLYMWALLKKKEILLSEARVLGVGPRFMSIYIQKLAIERRIYYEDVEGLMVEWLEATSTVVLSNSKNRHFQRRGGSGKSRALDDVALVISPCSLNPDAVVLGGSEYNGSAAGAVKEDVALGFDDPESTLCYNGSDVVDPAVYPLTVRLLSTIPVALHAVGGDDGPIDIEARLYIGSYFG